MKPPIPLLATTLCLAMTAAHLHGDAQDVRIEHDLLGEMAIPANAYYGVQTARAIENFPISGRTLSAYPELINGYAQVKMAAAMGNTDITVLQPTVAAGYDFLLKGEKIKLGVFVAAGYEVNIVTSGEEVGEGGISIIGASFAFTLK